MSRAVPRAAMKAGRWVGERVGEMAAQRVAMMAAGWVLLTVGAKVVGEMAVTMAVDGWLVETRAAYLEFSKDALLVGGLDDQWDVDWGVMMAVMAVEWKALSWAALTAVHS